MFILAIEHTLQYTDRHQNCPIAMLAYYEKDTLMHVMLVKAPVRRIERAQMY